MHASFPFTALYLPATQGTQSPPSGPHEPASQTQAVDDVLAAGELEFVGHASHVVLAFAPTAAEKVPAGQDLQIAIAPTMSAYVPAGHCEHWKKQTLLLVLILRLCILIPSSLHNRETVCAPAETLVAGETEDQPQALVCPACQSIGKCWSTRMRKESSSSVGAIILARKSTLACDVHSNSKESDPGPCHPTPSGISTCPPELISKEPGTIAPWTADISLHAPQPGMQTHAALAAVELEFAGHGLHVEFAVAPTTAEYVPALHELHRWLPATGLYLPATHWMQVPPSGPQ